MIQITSLSLTFHLPASCPAEVSPPLLPPTSSTPIPSLHWDGARKDKYVPHMKERRASLADCHSKVHANQLDSAFHQLGSIMVEAASEADRRKSSGAKAAKGNRGKPYFNCECRELRAKFRWAMRHDVDSVRVLA